MFGIDSSEFLVIVIIAVIVIGPKDLPRALYKVGQIVGKAQGMARHFRTGLDAMVREVELEELEKKWAAQNKRIMAEHPADGATDMIGDMPAGTGALPAPQEDAPSHFVAQSAPVEAAPVEAAPLPDAPVAPVPAPAATTPPAAEGPPYLAAGRADGHGGAGGNAAA